ncbi:MAG: hypothetical protein E7576_14005 [Ruminococcaceae bacterium]|jgi:hypothetical protein|nr:hypothetical protein [Oscillospiraceae bacterium]
MPKDKKRTDVEPLNKDDLEAVTGGARRTPDIKPVQPVVSETEARKPGIVKPITPIVTETEAVRRPDEPGVPPDPTA